MASGPSLIFVVMTQIFSKLPGGRLIGIFFFIALLVCSALHIVYDHRDPKQVAGRIHAICPTGKSTTITSLIIFAGGIIVSLGFGVLSNVRLPFLDVHGVAYYNIYNWLDTFTAYILLPLGCLLTCFYVARYGVLKISRRRLYRQWTRRKVLPIPEGDIRSHRTGADAGRNLELLRIY